MTPDAQRIAIAEACGWKRFRNTRSFERNGRLATEQSGLPNYLNDLNAMHDAEMTALNMESLSIMDEHLNKMERGYVSAIHATAAQRAEAFLRTLNLWTT